MADCILEIAEPGRRVFLERGFVVIANASRQELGRVALDAIAALILSAEDAMLSKAVLARLAEENIPVVICGANYMPLAIAAPISAHYRQLAVAESQIHASPVLKKNLWREIVRCKMTNQARALQKCRPEQTEVIASLQRLASAVQSGDKDNKEARAARLYWPALFGEDFLRDPDLPDTNARLNYGYAVIRAALARALCGAGLLPQFGLFHHNAFNAFCLADDLMEPLRPYMDCLVFGLEGDEGLTPACKRALTGILRIPLWIEGEKSVLSSVAARMAQGLVRSFASGEPYLPLPYWPQEEQDSLFTPPS